MHTEPHNTQETQPQQGDLLMRLCGTFGVVERIDEAHVMHVHLLHSQKFETGKDSIMYVATDLIGVTWQVIA